MSMSVTLVCWCDEVTSWNSILDGDSGSNKCKRGYGGLWWSQRLARVLSQSVGFVLVLLAEIWLQLQWRCFRIKLYTKTFINFARICKTSVATNCITFQHKKVHSRQIRRVILRGIHISSEISFVLTSIALVNYLNFNETGFSHKDKITWAQQPRHKWKDNSVIEYVVRPLTSQLFSPQTIYEHGQPRWNDIDRVKPNNSKKPVAVSLCPSKTQHILTMARTRFSAVRGLWITAWAMERPVFTPYYWNKWKLIRATRT
jgi:hypothetical protein